MANSLEKIRLIGVAVGGVIVVALLGYTGWSNFDNFYNRSVHYEKLRTEGRTFTIKIKKIMLKVYENNDLEFYERAFDFVDLSEKYGPGEIGHPDELKPFFEKKGEYFKMFDAYGEDEKTHKSVILAPILNKRRKTISVEGQSFDYDSYNIGERIIPSFEEYTEGKVPLSLVFYDEDNPDSSEAVHFNEEHEEFSNRVYQAVKNNNQERIDKIVGEGKTYQQVAKKYKDLSSDLEGSELKNKFRDYVEEELREDLERIKFSDSIKLDKGTYFE